MTLHLSRQSNIHITLEWASHQLSEFKGFWLCCSPLGLTTGILFLPPHVSWMRYPYGLQLVMPHALLILRGWSNDRDCDHDESLRPGSCFINEDVVTVGVTHPKLPLSLDGSLEGRVVVWKWLAQEVGRLWVVLRWLCPLYFPCNENSILFP